MSSAKVKASFSQKTERDLPQSRLQKKVRSPKYSLAGFEKFCRELKTEDGEPLRVEPFQRRFLRDHFAGVIELVVVIPKKNGKTTIFAALALYHLENWPDAEVILVASSHKQASIMFRQAMKMIKRSELEHRFDCRDGYKIIRLQGQKMGPQLKVLAADADTADGELPTLGLVDELHRHPNGELYGVLRDGCEARAGRMVTMSTAGAKQDSPLGRIRAAAQKLSTYKRKGTYCHAYQPEGSFSLHEWSLRDEDDTDNLRLVKRANPMSNHTIESLRVRKMSKTMTTGRWLRFACGIWTEGEEPWLTAADWDCLEVDIGRLQNGDNIWMAINAGVNSALAWASPREDGGAAVGAMIFEGTESQVIMEHEILELSETYQLEEATWDRGFVRTAENLQEQGLEINQLPYSTERLTNVTATVEELIKTKKLRHDGNPALRAQVLAATVKDSERGRRLINTSETRAVIAMAVACHEATAKTEPPPLIVIGSGGVA